MIKTLLRVDGMACGMCEAHVNEAVRKTFPKIKKVTSSHAKGTTEILSDEPLPQKALTDAINATGYTVVGFSQEPYEKKGFRLFGK